MTQSTTPTTSLIGLGKFASIRTDRVGDTVLISVYSVPFENIDSLIDHLITIRDGFTQAELAEGIEDRNEDQLIADYESRMHREYVASVGDPQHAHIGSSDAYLTESVEAEATTPKMPETIAGLCR